MADTDIHWYVVDTPDGKKLINPDIPEPLPDPVFSNGWYLSSNNIITNDKLIPLLQGAEPGFWYIKNNELSNTGLIPVDMDLLTLWTIYPTEGYITSNRFPELAPMGSFCDCDLLDYILNSPGNMFIGPDTYKNTNLTQVKLNPECVYFDTSFPPDCVIDKFPCSITITQNPTKMTYSIGEELDLTGLEITATLSTGGGEPNYSYIVDNSFITASGFDSSTTGDKEVILTYATDSGTATITVTVQ